MIIHSRIKPLSKLVRIAQLLLLLEHLLPKEAYKKLSPKARVGTIYLARLELQYTRDVAEEHIVKAWQEEGRRSPPS